MHKNTLSLVLFLSAAGSSIAGTVTYSTLSAWNADGTNNGVITFTTASLGVYQSPQTFDQVAFYATIGSPPTLQIAGNFGPGTGNFIATIQSMILGPASASTIFGLGFNLGCYSCSGNQTPSVVVTDVNNNIFTFSGMSTPGFWGVRSDVALSTVRVSYGTDYVALDNIAFSTQGNDPPPTGDTPEAATLILIGTGLGVIARYRRYVSLSSAI
jgi:hypothetical protein